jgi:hypothetical protein
MKRTRLVLRGETIRMLQVRELSHARGGLDDSRAACTTAATAGDTGCYSEATGCASICEWSCINHSCTVQAGDQDA